MFRVNLIPVDIGTTIRKKRVAIYARVSKRLDEQETSYELQVNELIKSVESNPGYELVSVFADKESGMKTKNRPAFNQMMNLARIGGLDMIITKSVSRFGRNAIEIPKIIRELRDLGVSVYFERENISTKDFLDEFLLNILSSVAEEESRQTSANIRWSFDKKMSKGENITLRLYGYKIVRGEFQLNEEEAAVIRTIYDWYINEVPYTEMIRRLYSMNIKSPTGKHRWASSTIENILTNEKYCGDAILGRRREKVQTNPNAAYGEDVKYIVRNNHKGIIAREMFDWVKSERIRRTKHHNVGKPRTTNPESEYFYSVELEKYFRYKVERPKGKYELPILLAVGNDERRMFHYKKIVEGIEVVGKQLVKKFPELVVHYAALKEKTMDPLESELASHHEILKEIDDIEDKLNGYDRASNLQMKRLALENIDKSLRTLRSSTKSLLDDYSIEKVKKVFSSAFIDGLKVFLVINLTGSEIEYSKKMVPFVSVKVPYVSNYKQCELTFNVILR